MPKEYYCFCGKARAPEWNRRDVAHSCGEICGRLRAKNNCFHKCTLLCHPGACPECIAMVTRNCGCEKTSQSLKCSTTTLVVCEAVCEKMLNCRIHNCEKKCHHGDCGPCEKLLHQGASFSYIISIQISISFCFLCPHWVRMTREPGSEFAIVNHSFSTVSGFFRRPFLSKCLENFN